MIISRRDKPRRGRVVNEDFLAFARSLGCVLKDRHQCIGHVTFHHVREYGSPKDDTRGFGLCAAGHLYECGEFSIERLGKRRWQEHWCIEINTEIARVRSLYQNKKDGRTMERSRVYAAIDTERVHQDRKWGGILLHPHEVGAWLTIMRVTLAKAEHAWMTQAGDVGALDEIRQVLAVGVACCEQHGIQTRSRFVEPPVESMCG